MMDFYSIEQIAYAKIAEDRETAAAAHLADKASAIRLAGRTRVAFSPAGLMRRLVRILTHPAAPLVPTTQTPRAHYREKRRRNYGVEVAQ